MINRCRNTSTTAEVFTGDYDAGKESAVNTSVVTVGEVNMGAFSTCDTDFSEFLFFDIGTDHYALNFPEDSLTFTRTNNRTSIYTSTRSATMVDFTAMDINLHDTVPHTYKERASVYANGTYYRSIDSVEFTVTAYDKVNEFIELNFTGLMQPDSSVINYPFSGSAKVRRMY